MLFCPAAGAAESQVQAERKALPGTQRAVKPV